MPLAPATAQNEVRLRIAGGPPLTWDPARAGETSSANVLAQVFEGLTAFDWQNNVQPALAESWTVSDDGTRIEFRLRPGIAYSDGTPITAQHFVESWLRVIHPAARSPLASLLADVRGANDYLAGRVGAEAVGLSAPADDTLVVELRRPATYFLAVTGSPTLAVVPPQMRERLHSPVLPDAMVVSGAYVPIEEDADSIRFDANPRYWAGERPLGGIELVTDIGGIAPVNAFRDGTVDYLDIGDSDASWMRFDSTLGPQLRSTEEFVVHYYGFDTTRPPFDDPRVRLAFAKAVDWDAMVRLADEVPATSLVPAGIPGGGTEDYRPSYDPAAARAFLDEWRAEATPTHGAPDPLAGLALVSNGYGYEVAVAEQLEENLGIEVGVEFHDFAEYLALRETPFAPRFWTVSWSADYPHAHDFLGLLLETGSSSNEGDWSNAEYDALIEQAAATVDPAEQEAIYARAQEILREEAPIIPVSYGSSAGGWALSRTGLLGALPSGVGYLRWASLDWAEGSGR
jgi:oligopeptide transport system substrate-binding protein